MYQGLFFCLNGPLSQVKTTILSGNLRSHNAFRQSALQIHNFYLRHIPDSC